MRQWWARMPELLTLYLTWTNRAPWRRRWSVVAIVGAWLFIAIDVHAERSAAIALLAWTQRHEVFLATVAALVSAALVARRRALRQVAASRSWTAALPVEPTQARCQAFVIDSMPALVMACALAAIFGGLLLIALFEPALPMPRIAWAAITGGVLAGAGFGRLIPKAANEELYEGSRYVPHRRVARPPIPCAAWSALGSWPVRQAFASARPKTLARTLIPVLLAVPMGAAAADVMPAIALLAGGGAMVLLMISTRAVIVEARRWLMPLPLAPELLLRKTLPGVLLLLGCMACVEAWLLWLLEAGGRR